MISRPHHETAIRHPSSGSFPWSDSWVRDRSEMHSALADLGLDRIFVIFPGRDRFRLHKRVDAVGLSTACTDGLG